MKRDISFVKIRGLCCPLLGVVYCKFDIDLLSALVNIDLFSTDDSTAVLIEFRKRELYSSRTLGGNINSCVKSGTLVLFVQVCTEEEVFDSTVLWESNQADTSEDTCYELAKSTFNHIMRKLTREPPLVLIFDIGRI